MRNTLNTLLILLVLIISQKACKGIECYQCSSSEEEMCDFHQVDEKYLQPCPETHNFCRKATYIYYFTGSRDYHVVRECARLWSEEKVCYKGRYNRDSYQYVCECRESGCNRSATSGSYLPVILALQLTVVFDFWIT